MFTRQMSDHKCLQGKHVSGIAVLCQKVIWS